MSTPGYKKIYNTELQNAVPVRHSGIAVGLGADEAVLVALCEKKDGTAGHLLFKMSIQEMENLQMAITNLLMTARSGRMDA